MLIRPEPKRVHPNSSYWDEVERYEDACLPYRVGNVLGANGDCEEIEKWLEENIGPPFWEPAKGASANDAPFRWVEDGKWSWVTNEESETLRFMDANDAFLFKLTWFG